MFQSKWKINDATYKYRCGYLNNDTIQPQYVILPQMNGYIKYFNDGRKNMSFVTDDEEVYEKYNEIWEIVKNLLKVDFTVGLVRDDIYLVAKLKIFNKVIKHHLIIRLFPWKKIITFAFQQ